MTQEEKSLLLKDLCARVPYHPKGHVVNACNGAECDEWLTCATFTMFTSATNNCRLYLRPISSMTKDELKDFMTTWEALKHRPDTTVLTQESYDWLNAHHFDFRNLIERGLAIDCTSLNIY